MLIYTDGTDFGMMDSDQDGCFVFRSKALWRIEGSFALIESYQVIAMS